MGVVFSAVVKNHVRSYILGWVWGMVKHNILAFTKGVDHCNSSLSLIWYSYLLINRKWRQDSLWRFWINWWAAAWSWFFPACLLVQVHHIPASSSIDVHNSLWPLPVSHFYLSWLGFPRMTGCNWFEVSQICISISLLPINAIDKAPKCNIRPPVTKVFFVT